MSAPAILPLRSPPPAPADGLIVVHCRHCPDIHDDVPGPAPGNRWPALVLAASAEGLDLLLPRRFDRGTILEVELSGNAAAEPTVVPVRVEQVRMDGRRKPLRWAFTCAFVAAPTGAAGW